MSQMMMKTLAVAALGGLMTVGASAADAKACSKVCDDALKKYPLRAQKIFAPDAMHNPTNRFYTGIPSIAIAKNGRLWATWYTGPTWNEDPTNYSVLTTSTDGGKTWKEVYISDPDGLTGCRTFDPQVWIAPNGKLYWSWVDRIGDLYSDPKSDQVWFIELDPENEPTDPHPKARFMATGIMMGKPTVLSTGEWLFPVARWFDDVSARVVVSTDGGKTFTERGGASLPKNCRAYDEHMIVEKKNGDLWMLIRSGGPNGGISESFSKDRGKTWTAATAAKGIKHTSSRFFIRRLASGALLLVKHGPIDQDVGRKQLTAYLSDDDGATWPHKLVLAPWIQSYPDGVQDKDGKIYVTFDCHRRREREIQFVSFTEEMVRTGDRSQLRTSKITKSTGPELKLPAKK